MINFRDRSIYSRSANAGLSFLFFFFFFRNDGFEIIGTTLTRNDEAARIRPRFIVRDARSLRVSINCSLEGKLLNNTERSKFFNLPKSVRFAGRRRREGKA